MGFFGVPVKFFKRQAHASDEQVPEVMMYEVFIGGGVQAWALEHFF